MRSSVIQLKAMIAIAHFKHKFTFAVAQAYSFEESFNLALLPCCHTILL